MKINERRVAITVFPPFDPSLPLSFSVPAQAVVSETSLPVMEVHSDRSTSRAEAIEVESSSSFL